MVIFGSHHSPYLEFLFFKFTAVHWIGFHLEFKLQFVNWNLWYILWLDLELVEVSMYRAFKKEFFTSYLFVKHVTSESSERFHIGSKWVWDIPLVI